jgi:hypothetical protein
MQVVEKTLVKVEGRLHGYQSFTVIAGRTDAQLLFCHYCGD